MLQTMDVSKNTNKNLLVLKITAHNDFISESNFQSTKPLTTNVLLYKNQSTDLQSKSIDWFIYETDICRLRVK